jgi:hypothetical protein
MTQHTSDAAADVTQESSTDEAVLRSNSEFMSQTHYQLMECLSNNPQKAKQVAKVALKANDGVPPLKDYQLSSWPVIIGQAVVSQFESVIGQYPVVLQKAIGLYFEDDADAFAAYMVESPVLYQLFKEAPLEHNDFVFRYDLVCSAGKMKILEVNAGSNLGGWALDWLHQKVTKALTMTPVTAKKPPKYRPIIHSLIVAVMKMVSNLNKADQTNNILFSASPDAPPEMLPQLRQYVQMLYQSIPGYAGGEILMCVNAKGVVFHDNDDVSYQGKKVDALIMLQDNIAQDVMLKFISSFMAKKIACFDTPMHMLFGHKALLALVHEDKVQAGLSEQQRLWVKEHVPWTVKFDRSEVDWQGERVQLMTMMKENKDQLVLKKVVSMRAMDVVIGKDVSAVQWAQSIDDVMGSSEEALWIVQQFCQPDPVLVADVANDVVAHNIVWGTFGFSDQYGGVFNRAIPTSTSTNIVSCSKGSIVLTAMEEV